VLRSSTFLKATVIAMSIPGRARIVPDDLHDGTDRRYVRRNQQMSKLVYRSQVVRNVFGANAARMFMRLMGVDAIVAQRVLRAPLSKLRR
jgi:steroid 5-alpha reductase family enzyme